MDNDFATGYALGADSNGGNCNNGGMWGGEWFWAIIILAMFWGNGGWGGFGGNGNGALQGALTRADLCSEFNFNGLENSVRGVQQGLCDGFYAVNTSLLNGFNGVDNAICTLGYQNAQLINGVNSTVQQGFNSANVVALQNQNALQTQLAQCCCDNRQMISDLKYDMATSDCSIKTLINQLVQQIMWGQQNGIRDLTDLINNKFCQLEMSQKDAIIADLRTQLAQCGDQNMANSIVARLSAVINPPAVPSYPAANPNGCGSWPASFLTGNNCNSGYYGYNNNCGCNSGCCGCNG